MKGCPGYRFAHPGYAVASAVAPNKTGALIARPLALTARARSVETAGGVGEHGVDLARVRGEIASRQHLAAVVARHLVEQPLELADVAVDGAPEIAIGPIALADFLERLLALHGVELAREYVEFAALVAIPQLGRRVVVDHAGDVYGERIEGVDGVALRARGLGRRFARGRRFAWRRSLARGRLGLVRGAREQLGEPARAPAAGLGGTERGRLGAPRRHDRRRGHAGDVRALADGFRPRAAVGARRLLAGDATADRLRGLRPARHRLDRLHPARRRLDRVEAAAVASHDPVELGQRLDLIDDDAPHVGGGVRRLLRQLEDALAHLGARALELATHLGGHLLQLVEHVGEALRRLREHAMRLFARLLVDAAHRLAQACTLFLGAAADRFEILDDRLGARGRGFRGHAGDVARALARGFERLVEHAGKAREPLFQIAGLAVERGGELFQRGAALGQRAVGALIAGVDQGDRFRERARMRVELARDLAQIVERLRGHRLEARDVSLDVAVGRAGLLRHVVHGGDELGHPRDQRALDVAHVLVRAAEHLLQQNVGLAQALVECGRVRPQHVLRLLDLGDGA